MPTRYRVLTFAITLFWVGGAGAQEPVDREMVERIKAEGSERSRVGELFNHFTNVIGGRLTASPAHREAVEYARGRLEGWGLDNVHLEAWEFGRGWTLERCSIEMLEPRYLPMIGYPHGWSASTDGRLVAEPVLLGDMPPETLGDRAGPLSGAIVLTRPIQADFVREDRPAPRADYRPSSAPPRPTAEAETARAARARLRTARNELTAMLRREGAGVLLEPNIGEHGTLFVTGRDQGEGALPSVVLSAEHYNLVARLIAQGMPVTLAVEVRARFNDDDLNTHNLIAEIAGTDPEIGDEVVMVGAHLDSWHSASGATDNADGSSVAMEALRILEALGVRPRRTIRLALWSGEEQGLLGSREYVRRHLEGDANQAERDRFSVYFNLDNGLVPIYGFYLEGNEAMRPIMDAYLRPFQDYTSMYNTQQGIGATDHLSFLRTGVPGYQAIHDYTDYDVRTHHTNMDTFDRIDGESLVHAAVVMASILYHAAMRDEKMPRDPTWRPGR